MAVKAEPVATIKAEPLSPLAVPLGAAPEGAVKSEKRSGRRSGRAKAVVKQEGGGILHDSTNVA